jgi:hypothetical protein
MASVWPYSGLISSDDNHAASDRSQTVSASVNLALNTWYHIAFTYKSGVGIKLYLNGELVAERTGVSGPIQNSLGAPIYIGRLVQPFAGIIDEVQIYPYALSNTNINSYYLSTKDGLSENSTFYPAGIAAQGSTLSCTVIPSDSYGDGIPRSASITLNPALPVASNLQVTPTRSSNARLDGENLGAVYTYTNIDGITESGSQIRWYMNGTLQNSLNDTTTIPAATTQIGQTWYFTVTPRTSGGIFGVTQTSPTITIRNNTAPTTGIPTLNSTDGGPAFDDEDLTCTAATTTDADGDETTNIFHWTKGGVSQTNLQVPFDTEVPSISGSTGSTRDYSGYNNNGQVNGATWIKDGVVGGGFSFDGNDYIRVQESGNTLGRNGSWSKVSVEFWIKATGVTSAESAIIKHNNAYSTGSSSYGVGYRVDFRAYANQDRFYWYVYNSTSSASIQYSDTTNFGLWHHIVCTYESGIGLKLYVDGIVRASTPFSGNINATLDGLLDIGGLGSGTGDFSGLLDEVRIYPNALSAAQVFQRFIETKDGQSTSSSIVAQETSTGDNWVCQVTPNDMWVDGTAKNSSSLTVAAVSGNSRPRIDSYSPTNSSIGVNENATLSFTQVSSDPNNDTLTYSWTLDTVEQATTQNWTYSPNFTSQGSRNIRVTVSDGSLTDYQEWTVNVVDVPNEFVNLTIIASANGNTNPIPGTYQFGVGSNTTVQAIPNSGYILSHWLLNGTNVGSANPCSMTMNANYNLTAVFNGVPPPIQYNLHVEVSGSGITNATGDSLHENGTAVSIKATANTGWTFSHWLRNGTNIGSTNPYSQSINANYNFTAVFVLEEYTLTINIVGDGSVVKSPNQITYHYGDDVQLTADPGDGWRFAGWSGDATGIELVKIIDMTGNKVVTATFQIINPPNPLLFEDGFESNSFSAWSSTTRTTGETTSTVSNIVHTDSYGAMFTSNGGLSYERAYATRSGLSLPEIFVRAYVYVDQSGTADNGDRFYFMQLMSGTNIIAYAGWRQDSSGNLHWHIMIRDGTSYVGAYSATVPATDSWYCLELHWKADSTIGLGELFVNDQLVVSITNRNTANYGSATSARIGLPEIYNCASTTVYVDDVAIDESYIGPLEEGEPEYVSLTIGSASFGVTNPIAGTYQYEKNDIVYITATANPGYILIGWTIDGTGVAPTNPYSLTMNADHSLTPIFAILPPVYYDLTVATSGSGSTNATGTNSYLEDSMVTVLATASENYVFSYWLLNGTNVGSANPYIVTVDANYGLTAVFIETSANVFEDGFESGSFGAWSSTSATSGETRSVVAVPVYSGVYAASFTANGGGGYEKAYLIESLSSSLGVVSVEGKFMISQNGIVESGDRVKLIELRSGSSIIAAAGLRQRTSGLSLWLETRDGTSYVETYVQSSVDISQWFTLELQWLNDASTGSSSLLINGTPLIQVSNDNTSNYGDCTEVRIGLPEVYNCGSITLYVDDIIINNTL